MFKTQLVMVRKLTLKLHQAMPIYPAPLFHFSLEKIESYAPFRWSNGQHWLKSIWRLVDIGRNRQLDVLIHISSTLAIKLQPNSAVGGHH